MALITPSPLIGAISGSIGPATLKLTRNGPLLTKRPRRTTNRSQAMHLSDSRFAALTLAWRTLTNDQRRAWSSLAIHLPKANALGIPHPPTGYQTFIAHNTPAYILSLALIPNPPPRPPLPPIHSVPTIWGLYSPPFRWYPSVPSPFFPIYMITSACLPAISVPTDMGWQDVPTDTAPFKRWRFLQSDIVTTSTPEIWYGAAFFAQYGYPQIHQRFAFKSYLWHPTALRSPSFITPGAAMPW